MGKGKERRANASLKKQVAEKLQQFFEQQPGKTFSFKEIFKSLKTRHASAEDAGYRCDGRDGLGRFLD